MYDAREKSMGQSGLLFGILTIVVISIAFFGILLMPSKSASRKISSSEINQSSGQLLAVLDDRSTQKFIAVLNRVSPVSAENLEKSVTSAIAGGADKDELAQLVMQSLEADMISNSRYLAKADVKHFDAILNLSESGLTKLSASNSVWCKGAHYEKFADLSPQKLESLIKGKFAYGTPGYDWGVNMSTILLEAIGDAKSKPKNYGTLTSQDEVAIQGLAMRMISNPQVMQLMTLQGNDKATMARAVRNLDFCSLGVTGIDAIQSLPEDTRGRLWAEGFRQINNGGLEKR